jgi:hypothetical protein
MGWVYALVSPSLPGIVKIGATERDPEERLREANACTWHYPDYTIACATEVDDPFAAERRIHIAFSLRRVDPRREFFRATAEEATSLIALTTNVGIAVAAAPPAASQSGGPRESAVARRPAPTGAAPLRAWVESTYTHVPLREKDSGMKLGDLFCAYVMAGVHADPVGKITFAVMLKSLYPGIGPHKNAQSTVSGLYLLR